MGILPVSGHDEGNDDLFDSKQASADDRRTRMFSWGGNPGTTHYDPETNQWVSDQNSGAEIAQSYYRGLANEASSKSAPTIDYSKSDYRSGQADWDRIAGYQARGFQGDALGLQRQAAMGQAPSVAQIQMQQGLDQAMRNQQSMAAGARGPAALALAQQNAAANTANMQQQWVNQSAALRAGEMAEARNAYMGGATGIRGQDLGAQGLSLQGQQIAGQQAQAQAQLQLGQNALNQQGQLGFEQMGMGVGQAQLNAAGQQQALEEGHWAGQASLDQHATDRDTGTSKEIIGGILKASDPRSKLNVRAEEMGTYPPWMPPFPVPSGANHGGIPLLTSDPRSKLNPRAEEMGTYPANILPPYPVPNASTGRMVPMLVSDPDLKENILSSPLASMGSQFGMAMLTSDPKAKEQARQEGAARMAHMIIQQERAAATPVARAAPPAQQPEQESPLIPGVGHLSNWIDTKVDPAAQERIQSAIGTGPLVPGVGHASNYIDSKIDADANARADAALAARAQQAQARLTSDPRAKQDAFEAGLAAAGENIKKAISGQRAGMSAPSSSEQYAAKSRGDQMGETASQAMGRSITPASYTYRQGAIPGDDGRRNYGVMTTDLEKTPMGRSLVEKGAANGYDAINVPKATGALLAQNADQQKQIDELKFGREAYMGRPDPAANYNPYGAESSVYGDDPELLAAREQYVRNGGRRSWGTGIMREYPDTEPGRLLASRDEEPEYERVWR